MLTPEENELLTRVGPGTPMGELLRRYWHPVAMSDQMHDRWTKRVRIMGEDLVLFKDRTGRLGLIAEACPHRRASFAYGIPTAEGIRCPYHGWMFDGSGRCLEQPNEPEGSTFKDKVATTAYPVQELGGLVWAYLGPLPAPLLPAHRRLRRRAGGAHGLGHAHRLQLAADHGELGRSGAHRMAARQVLRVRARERQRQGRVLGPPRQDRVRRGRVRDRQTPADGRTIRG